LIKQCVGVGLRGLVLLLLFGSIGPALNLFAKDPVPWIYVPPTEIVLQGIKIPLVDEIQAKKLFDDPTTVFVDARQPEHYDERHVKGALLMPPKEKEERFVMVQPLLPEDCRIVLYCYGPDCDAAEHVASFLAQMGYTQMFIMNPGFVAWEKAGFPVETAGDKSRSSRNDE
jgi:rhodanese-related sulfurtransferase